MTISEQDCPGSRSWSLYGSKDQLAPQGWLTQRPHQVRCGAAALLASAPCFLLCLWAIALLSRFSPVFKPIRCTGGDQDFLPPAFDANGIALQATAKMTCSNPNSYPLQVFETSPGRVMVWPDMDSIGMVSVVPFAMPGKATVSMVANITMMIPMATALSLMSKGVAKVVLELNMQGTAEVGLFITTIRFTQDQPAKCGFHMKAQLPMTYGPPLCAATVDELVNVMPSIGSNETAVFFFGPQPELLDAMTTHLHTICGLSLMICGLLGLALTACSAVLFRRVARSHCTEADQEAPPAQVAAYETAA